MTRRLGLVYAVVCFGALVSGATAQSVKKPYSAADIVSHFAPDLGPSRALCIGTESECAKAVAPKVKPANFDLVVNFEYRSDVLTEAARQNLEEFATALKDPRLGRASFVVEGHTDGRGGDTYNLELSNRRANAVVAFLKERGVDAERLEARGYGKLKPIGGNVFDPSNRRVETRLRTE